MCSVASVCLYVRRMITFKNPWSRKFIFGTQAHLFRKYRFICQGHLVIVKVMAVKAKKRGYSPAIERQLILGCFLVCCRSFVELMDGKILNGRSTQWLDGCDRQAYLTYYTYQWRLAVMFSHLQSTCESNTVGMILLANGRSLVRRKHW